MLKQPNPLSANDVLPMTRSVAAPAQTSFLANLKKALQSGFAFTCQTEIIRTTRARRKLRNRGLRVFRKAHFFADRTATLDSDDHPLHVGCSWQNHGFRSSQMVLLRNSTLRLRGDFKFFTGCQVSVNEGALLVLGNGYANNGLNLACFEKIEIGSGGAIGENVTIRDSDTYVLDTNRPATAPIKIGNEVWLGMNSTILKGVTISDGAVIAAGAVVNRDVPARALVAGVPATVKKTDVIWQKPFDP